MDAISKSATFSGYSGPSGTYRTGLDVRLAARPKGLPTPGDFEITEVAVPDPAPGQVLVRNLFMSLDPGMLMLIAGESGLPMPRYEVGEVMYGDAIGEVVASADPSLGEGDLVMHRFGWREYAVAQAGLFRRVDRDAYPTLSTYLGFGLVAYVGLMDAAELRPGDTVFVSSAAGATGSMAGQIARLKGASRVIGSAGSPDKVAHLTGKLGFDAAFDHHDGPIEDRLREAAPHGIDVYFDNVGGEQLRAAIDLMNPHGRIAVCGALNRQTKAGPGAGPDDGPGDLLGVLGKRLTIRGFTVGDHLKRAPEFGAQFRAWLREGSIVYDETVIDGLANAPQALLDLVNGAYTGKTVVRLGS
ncbi:NADP-dependent oxidoreductase [Streptomyces avermitilis]|uniref:NADP-dependent oxidoreductase n=2 Tax=Streptomyces avermitilis TaxID=33903 RepID=A0A4D4MIE9_STRAX|nr:NADP-dependent oxidoreductase [Streptomyces avermitilis]OOV21286.1 NADP-dependent oxidoreductase [Streptomyces avermitilis]GDY71465.1 NADP-dependent oxidoreductase [Streptomyces avermitilis]